MIVTYGLVAFAAVFVVVGMFRIVEFKAAGLSVTQQRLLIPLHILGCFAFAGATYLLGIDPAGEYHRLMSWLFYGSVLTLFPIHIFVAIKRRIRLSK